MKGSMTGYAGSVLTINLNDESKKITQLQRSIVHEYLGGKGLAAKVLLEELSPETKPLSPENIILFVNGPLTGTLAPSASRCVLATKSPLTGGWLDSNCGGVFGPELKAAGFDMVKIVGKASRPVYIVINNDDVSIEDAGSIWGKDTFSTHKTLKAKHGEDYKVACIGPAGEEQVLIACVQAEGRSFGRGGSGAVLGSKNLKAIVVKGSNSTSIHNLKGFMRICRESFNEVAINPDTGGSRPKYGTNSIYSFIRESGVLPIKNFQGGEYQGVSEVDEDSIVADLFEQDRSCFACPIACSKYSVVKKGKYKGSYGEGPEYENFWSLGAQCGNKDLGAVLQGEYLCDYYGMDAVSAGNIIGFLMECFEKGIVSEKEIGFNTSFGNDEAIIKLIHLMGQNKDIGRILASGVARASQVFGGNSSDFAMHVKGMELPAYDPRAAVGMGLAFATSDRGGCHLRAWPVGTEILNNLGRLDPLTSEHKAELVKTEQDWFSVINSIGICLFATFALGPNQITKLLYNLTGIENFSSAEKLLSIGERIYNVTRIFNNREGMLKDHDSLPPRLLSEGSTHHAAKGNTVPLEEMLEEYYLIRGWDKEGKPTQEKLRSLGIQE